MWYGLIRISLGIVLLVGLVVWLKHTRFRVKRYLYPVCLLVAAVLTTFFYFLPVENGFVDFASPEQVFAYSMSGEIQAVAEGEASALLLYRNQGANGVAFARKGERGWKIGTYFSYQEVASRTVDKRIVTLYRWKGTQDYYAVLWEPTANAAVHVTDSKGTTFQLIQEPAAQGTSSITYYGFVGELSQDYFLLVDGKKIAVESLITFYAPQSG